MSLFAKRPLALGCAAFLSALILSEIFSFALIWILLLVGVLLFILSCVRCFLRPYAARPVLLLLLGLGLLAGTLRVLPIHLREQSLKQAQGGEITTTFVVEDILVAGAYHSEAFLDVRELNGEATNARAILKLDAAMPFVVGDTVTAVCLVGPLDADNYVENRHLNYRAQGAAVQLHLIDTTSINVVGGEQGFFARITTELRMRANGRIRTYIKGDAGALAAAMLLDEREGLSAAVTSDFRYAGVSHLLALSGLHLGILAVLLEKLLLGIGLSKRWRIFVLSLSVLCYLTLTGFPISLLRAALMLLLVQTAFLCRTRADATTSLFLAATVMLFISPLSFFSLSCQMTLLATFGILTVGRLSRVLFGKLRKKRGFGYKLLLWPLSSLLLTLAASLFTYPIQWFTFGEVSLITPLSNLLLIFPTTIFLYLTTLTLCLFPAALFGRLAGLLGNFILYAAHGLGEPSVMLSLRGEFMPYLVLPSLILTVLLLCVRLRRKLLILLPHAVATLIFFLILLTRAAVLDGKTAVLYSRVEGAECMMVQDGGKTCMIDLGESKVGTLSTGVALLHELDKTRLDYYLVSDAGALNENRISRIASQLSPRYLLIPTSDDISFPPLAEIATRYGMEAITYEYNQPLSHLKYAEIYINADGGDRSVRITGKNESLLYQSGELISSASARYHILAAGEAVFTKPLAVGGENTTVIVSDEAVLLALIPDKNTDYILLPQKQGFLLQ